MVRVDAAEVALLRLVAQRLAGPREPDAAAAVARLLALQGQDLRASLVATALRTSSPDLGDVRAALDAGDVVRSWPVRGTLHLVLGEDLGWLLGLTSERVLRSAAARRTALGIDDALVERAREVLVAALEGGRRLSREQALALLADEGLLAVPQRGYHLLWTLAQTGTTCWGPLLPRPTGRPAGGGTDEQALVLLDEWAPRPRRLERDEALGELARRYVCGHGPATTADLVRWCGLTVRDVRAGLAVARPHLEAVEVDGVEHLVDPATPERLAEHREDARRVLLLPGFDELVLGYADRSASLPVEHASRVVPGSNGIFLATVVDDGRIVGTWRRTGRRTGPPVEATPFTTFSARVERALPGLGAALPA
ncbi:winged helix DNA-binding domain-containing protein [Pseudokineococcus basanitobsidens]|uniref:Winged helix DNA-binding domain-containing protein n=1 Tax=Pseudokineococcus basanitobsidens TaxID=1926649 RepID=A0ABU8RKB9_9ACTN